MCLSNGTTHPEVWISNTRESLFWNDDNDVNDFSDPRHCLKGSVCLSICPSICPSNHPSIHPSFLGFFWAAAPKGTGGLGHPLRGLGQPLRGLGGGTDGRRDRHTYARADGLTDSPCSVGLCLLRFTPEPLPFSHNCYHYKIPEQGKGTDDHLLPLGDWLLISKTSLLHFSLIPYVAFIMI